MRKRIAARKSGGFLGKLSTSVVIEISVFS
jgi:hypothetical protein